MIKEYFIDGLLQIAIVLSIFSADWQQHSNLLPSQNNFYDNGESFLHGQMVLSPLVDFLERTRGENNFGGYLHLKNRDSFEVENAIARVHSLSRYGNFKRLETRISAFLLDGYVPPTSGANNLRGGMMVINDGPSTSVHSNVNNPIGQRTADEPTKEDMDLIDVLWNQDMDLSMNEGLNELDQAFRWQLEREQELLLHEKQEEEVLEQMVQREVVNVSENFFLFNFNNQHLDHRELNNINNGDGTTIGSLNTPEVVLADEMHRNPFSNNVVDLDFTGSNQLFPNNQSLSRQLSLEGRWEDVLSVLQRDELEHSDRNTGGNNNAIVSGNTDGSGINGGNLSSVVELFQSIPYTSIPADPMNNFIMGRDVVDDDDVEGDRVLIQDVSLASFSSSSLNIQGSGLPIQNQQQQYNDDTMKKLETFTNSSGLYDDFDVEVLLDEYLQNPYNYVHNNKSDNYCDDDTITAINNNNNNIIINDDDDSMSLSNDFMGSQYDSSLMSWLTPYEEPYLEPQLEYNDGNTIFINNKSIEMGEILDEQVLLSISTNDVSDNNHHALNIADYDEHLTNFNMPFDFNDEKIIEGGGDDDDDFVDVTSFDDLMESIGSVSIKNSVMDSTSRDSALSSIINLSPSYQRLAQSHFFPRGFIDGLSMNEACGETKSVEWNKHNDLKQRFNSFDEDEDDCQSNEQLLNQQTSNHSLHSTSQGRRDLRHANNERDTFNSNIGKVELLQQLNFQQQLQQQHQSQHQQQQTKYRWLDVKQIQTDHNYPSTFRGRSFASANPADDHHFFSDAAAAEFNDNKNAKFYKAENNMKISKHVKNLGDEDSSDERYTKHMNIKKEKGQKQQPTSFRSRDDKKVIEMKIPFNLDEIIYCPVDRFNEMITSTRYKLSESQIQLIKDIRKRGKNKMAAQNCRKRKLDLIQMLEEEVQKLKKEREEIREEKKFVDKNVEMVRSKIEKLQNEIFKSLQTENDNNFNDCEQQRQQQPSDERFDGSGRRMNSNSSSSTNSNTRSSVTRSINNSNNQARSMSLAINNSTTYSGEDHYSTDLTSASNLFIVSNNNNNNSNISENIHKNKAKRRK